MKNRTATPPDELISALQPPASRHEGNGPESVQHDRSPYLRIQKRTITFVLTLAVVLGGVLLLLGYHSLAKGLILGSLFSSLNFFLMAVFLPLHIGQGRSRVVFISLTSICLRLALLAIPLIVAVNHSQFAISSTIVGLVMVQIVIIVDQLWFQPRNYSRD